MEIIKYLTYHAQPLLGLSLGLMIVLVAGFLYSKTNKRMQIEEALPPDDRSMSSSFIKLLLSFGLMVGGVMIIIAIKFLSS